MAEAGCSRSIESSTSIFYLRCPALLYLYSVDRRLYPATASFVDSWVLSERLDLL